MARCRIGLLVACVSLFGSLPGAAQEPKEKRWFRGQLHCHSPKSFDWKGPPQTTLDDYMKAMKKRYDFVAVSDHNGITDTSKYDDAGFRTFPNHESAAGGHINMIDIQKPIQGHPKTLQEMVDAIVANGGIPMINHPSQPEVRPDTIVALKPMKTPLFIEVLGGWDGTDWTNYWDPVLSTGRQIYATGTSDCHDMPNDRNVRSWIEVFAGELTREAILSALRSGDFYATNGVLLESVTMKDRKLGVVSKNGEEIAFIGKDGKILKTVKGRSASYALPPSGLYVRAKIQAGKLTAYTQAYFPK